MTNINKQNSELKTILKTIVPYNTKIEVVQTGIINALGTIKRDGVKKLGFVSGIISSDGEKHIPANMEALTIYTEFYRTHMPFPVFSATDVFHPWTVKKFNLTQPEWFDFWNNVLNSGKITDVFMTPRWKDSQGSIEEHKTAKRLKLKVHYHQNKTVLIQILQSVRRDLEKI